MARHDAEREGQYVDQLEPIKQCSFDRGRQHPLCALCQRLARSQIVLLVSLQPVDLAFDIPCSAYHLTTFTIITPFPDLDTHRTSCISWEKLGTPTVFREPSSVAGYATIALARSWRQSDLLNSQWYHLQFFPGTFGGIQMNETPKAARVLYVRHENVSRYLFSRCEGRKHETEQGTTNT